MSDRGAGPTRAFRPSRAAATEANRKMAAGMKGSDSDEEDDEDMDDSSDDASETTEDQDDEVGSEAEKPAPTSRRVAAGVRGSGGTMHSREVAEATVRSGSGAGEPRRRMLASRPSARVSARGCAAVSASDEDEHEASDLELQRDFGPVSQTKVKRGAKRGGKAAGSAAAAGETWGAEEEDEEDAGAAAAPPASSGEARGGNAGGHRGVAAGKGSRKRAHQPAADLATEEQILQLFNIFKPNPLRPLAGKVLVQQMAEKGGFVLDDDQIDGMLSWLEAEVPSCKRNDICYEDFTTLYSKITGAKDIEAISES